MRTWSEVLCRAGWGTECCRDTLAGLGTHTVLLPQRNSFILFVRNLITEIFLIYDILIATYFF